MAARRYGLVTVERALKEGWLGCAAVFLNGTNVTRRAVALHDQEGWVDLLVEKKGLLQPNPANPAAPLIVRRYGTVVYRVTPRQ
jgi:hypothetical protein